MCLELCVTPDVNIMEAGKDCNWKRRPFDEVRFDGPTTLAKEQILTKPNLIDLPPSPKSKCQYHGKKGCDGKGRLMKPDSREASHLSLANNRLKISDI